MPKVYTTKNYGASTFGALDGQFIANIMNKVYLRDCMEENPVF